VNLRRQSPPLVHGVMLDQVAIRLTEASPACSRICRSHHSHAKKDGVLVRGGSGQSPLPYSRLVTPLNTFLGYHHSSSRRLSSR
jgi:hypothetical protein